jgi:hypothetical protein
LVAAMMRASALMTVVLPTRLNSRSCSTRSSFTCSSIGMSPTSSRKSVPPPAVSKRPTRRSLAPVKAPRSWPKSSLSRRSRGIAEQLSATNGPLQRGEWTWIARAISSCPVPLSPSISTVASLLASRPMVLKISCIATLVPISVTPGS